MQDEEMDNMDQIIKEACESYHPAYNDKAWDKMELLLDKHLPQQKVRKKPFVFFLFLFLITGAVFLAIFYPGNKKEFRAAKSPQNEQTIIPVNTSTANTEAGKGDAAGVRKIIRNSEVLLQANPENARRRKFRKASPFSSLTKANYRKTSSSGTAGDFVYDDTEVIKNETTVWEKQTIDKITTPVSFTKPVNYQVANAIEQPAKYDSAVTNVAAITKKTTPSKTSSGATVLNKKSGKKFSNNFGITLSAGPDLSFVRLGYPGKTSLNYGAGLSYTFAERITLRSGFYVTKKIYSAKPGDYSPPSWYWTYNINLQRVDADCKVYEIPLDARYNFKQSKNHNWLAGIGFSSYLIKSETYHYLFKNQQGQTMYRGWTATERNNHYFSVLTVSGGYQYRVNHQVSIIAEPYLKLPLSGVGFGKIKLNSGGLLITASIKPFARRK